MNLILGLLQTKHITNSDQVEEGHVVTGFMFLTGSIFYSWRYSQVLRKSTHALQIICIFF